MAGVFQADPRCIDPVPLLVQAPANPFLQQYAAAAQISMLRQKCKVVVVESALFEQAQPIADAAAVQLQRHDPHQPLSGEGGERAFYPLTTAIGGENPDAL